MTDDSLVWMWGDNPGDFNYYAIYRDAGFQNFVPSGLNLATMVSNYSQKNTSLTHGGLNYFYKVSAVDDSNYGGGYCTFDTIPPYIKAAYYYSNGTRTTVDDTLKLILSEYIADMTSMAFGSSFALYGVGNLAAAIVGSGVRINDDTLVITCTAACTLLAKNRSWIGFQAGAVEDYNGNQSRKDSVLVTTYNVVNTTTRATYSDINPACAAAGSGQTILVLDHGWYQEQVSIGTANVTLVSDSNRVVLIDGRGRGMWCG